MKFGKFFKNLRLVKKMTQDQLAEKLFVSRQTISNWERGINLPDIEQLSIIAKTFEVSLEEVLMQEIREQKKGKKIYLILSIFLAVFLIVSSIMFVISNKEEAPFYEKLEMYQGFCSSNPKYLDHQVTKQGDLISGSISGSYEIDFEFGTYCIPYVHTYEITEGQTLELDESKTTIPDLFILTEKETNLYPENMIGFAFTISVQEYSKTHSVSLSSGWSIFGTD